MWILIALGAGILALAHTAPAPFLFDAIAGRRAVWHMPRTDPPTIYLSFDDGPNPTTTPDLLDVLAREGVHATFFLIDRHITDQTAPLVRRIDDRRTGGTVLDAARLPALADPGDLLLPAVDLDADAANATEPRGLIAPDNRDG